MQVLSLFILGVSLGLVASFLTGMRTHLPRFNNVAIAIIGSLVGGMLSSALPLHLGAVGSVDIASLLLASITAATFLVILIALRGRIDGRI